MAERSGCIDVVFHGLGPVLLDLVEFGDELFRERGLLPLGLAKLHIDLCESGVNALDAFFGFFQSVKRKVEGAAVMHGQQEITQGFGQELGENVADGEKVSKRLGHLLGIDLHEPVVNPEIGKRLAGCGF